MKSFEHTFRSFEKQHPNLSTIPIFVMTVKQLGMSKTRLHHWFNRLVDKDDYEEYQRRELLAFFRTVKKELEA